MGVESFQPKTETTASYSTGSGTLSFAVDSVAIPGGKHLVCVTDTDATSRRQMTVKARNATYDPKTASFSKGKRSVSFVQPTYDGASGRVYYNTIRIEVEMHPGASASILTEFLTTGAQLCTDTNMRGFWDIGTL